MLNVDIYTDGACKGNPGVGGWGFYVIFDDSEYKMSGGNANTTNNRIELTAVIESLKYIDPKYTVNLYTDSKYVSNGITIWINNWVRNGWRTSNKKVYFFGACMSKMVAVHRFNYYDARC